MDLSARIKMINKTNGVTVEPQPITHSVEALSEQSKKDTEAFSPNPTEELTPQPTNEEVPNDVLSEILERLDSLTKAVESQATELKKINKHINATQKELKKKKN